MPKNGWSQISGMILFVDLVPIFFGQSMHRLTTLPEECNKALNGLKHFSKTGTGPVIGSVMEFNALAKMAPFFRWNVRWPP